MTGGRRQVELGSSAVVHASRDVREDAQDCVAYLISLDTNHIGTWYKLKNGKGSPYSIAECRAAELIPVLGSQPAGDLSHKSGGRLPLLSARHAVTLATLKRAAINLYSVKNRENESEALKYCSTKEKMLEFSSTVPPASSLYFQPTWKLTSDGKSCTNNKKLKPQQNRHSKPPTQNNMWKLPRYSKTHKINKNSIRNKPINDDK